MWLTREQWSVVLGGLMLEIERSERHKSANAESTSDERVALCRTLVLSIGAEANAPAIR